MRSTFSLVSGALLALAGVVAAGGTAQAQAIQVSRTSDYTVTWTGPNLSDASAVYAGSTVWSGIFTGQVWTFTVLPGATGLSFNEGPGITITSPSSLTPTPPYPSTIAVTFDGDGTTGEYWGWTETTLATTSGPILTSGTLGTLETLNVSAGGNEMLPGQDTPMDYYVYVYLTGNWTTEGTSTDDYTDLSWNPAFSTPMFTYDSGTNTTTVMSVDTDFVPSVGGGPELSFTLIGSTVPEPSTWAMLIIGFGGISFAAYRRGRKASAAAA